MIAKQSKVPTDTTYINIGEQQKRYKWREPVSCVNALTRLQTPLVQDKADRAAQTIPMTMNR
jgi:hypothetical protein